MKSFRRVVSTVLVLAMLVTSFGMVDFTSYAESEGDFYYQISDGEATLTGYSGAGGDVVIPDTLGGYPVTAIGREAFREKELTSVMIPDSVEVIGYASFDYNQLANIILPSSLKTIEQIAFQGNVLAKVDIPDGVVSIEGGAFNMNRLTSITLPDSLIDIGQSAFSSNKLITVDIPDSVETIGNYAFSGNELTSFTWPESVPVIGECVFQFNDFSNLVIPDGIERIGDGAFHNSNITSVVFPDSLKTIGKWVFQRNQLESINIPNSVTTIGDGAFRNNQLTTVELPQNTAYTANGNTSTFDSDVVVTRREDEPEPLPDYEYELDADGNATITAYNGAAKAIVIPNQIDGYNVTSIGDQAFKQKMLTSIELPTMITVIGKAAFYDNQISTLILPAELTVIGDRAFAKNQLSNIIISESVNTIGQGAFKSNQLTNIYIPDAVTTIAGKAFLDNQLTNVELSQETNYVVSGQMASFDSNVNITMRGNEIQNENGFEYVVKNGSATIVGYTGDDVNISIPTSLGIYSVTAIADFAFRQKQLTGLTFPETILKIGRYSFDKNNLKEVVFPDSLVAIDEGAFKNNELSIIELPQNTHYITIPDKATFDDSVTVTRRGDMPADEGDFEFTVKNNKALIIGYTGTNTQLIIPDTLGGYPVTAIGREAFREKELTSVMIPDSVEVIGYASFDYNQLANIILPSSLKTIEQIAFQGNVLAKVDIPDGVVSIEGGAFNMNRLTSITLPDSLIDIGQSAFSSNKLITVDIPDSVETIGNYAFSGNELTSFTWPESVPVIGECVFQFNDFSNLVIPDGIERIGDGAFHNSNITSVVFPDSLKTIGKWVFQRNQLESINIPNSVTTIGDGAFRNNQLTTVELPQNTAYTANGNTSTFDSDVVVTRREEEPGPLPDYEYELDADGNAMITAYNAADKDVVIPSEIDGHTVTAIGADAFAGKSLTSVTLPDSVATIGERTFADNQLTEIAISDYVTAIAARAFRGNQLTAVELWKDTQYAAEGTDASFDGDVVVSLRGVEPQPLPDYEYELNGAGNAMITAYNAADKDVVIPSEIDGHTVTAIGADAFAGKSLTSVTLPDSVTTIGERAFADNQLTEIAISDYVTAIAARTFRGNQLTAVELWKDTQYVEESTDASFDDGVTISLRGVEPQPLPDYEYELNGTGNATITAYNGAEKAIVIPAQLDGHAVMSIGDNAFAGKSLTAVTIPDSVTTIGERAFADNQLTEIAISDNVTTIFGQAFKNNLLTTVELWRDTIYLKGGTNATFDSNVTVTLRGVYTITFDANGGTGEMAALVVNVGEGCTLPANAFTKVDRIFANWNTAADGSGQDYADEATLSALDANTTLYARWGQDVFSHDKISYGFLNSYSAFTNGSLNDYTINQTYFNNLVKGLNTSWREYIKEKSEKTWGGSCYGMSFVKYLALTERINFANYDGDAVYLSDLDRPVQNRTVRDMINYFHLTQFLPGVWGRRLDDHANQQAALREVVEITSNEDIRKRGVLIGWINFDLHSGHEVFAVDHETCDETIEGVRYSHKISILDPNALDYNYLYISDDYTAWRHMPYKGVGSKYGYVIDYDTTPLLRVNNPIDGVAYTADNGSHYYPNFIVLDQGVQGTLSDVDSGKDYRLAEVLAGRTSLKVLPAAINGDGNDEVRIMLPSESTYAISSDSEQSINAEFMYQDSYVKVDSNNLKSCAVTPQGELTLSGQDATVAAKVTVNQPLQKLAKESIEITANGVDDLKVSQSAEADSIIVESDKLANVELYNSDSSSRVGLTLNTEEDRVMIKSSASDQLDVYGDSNDDGNFDTKLDLASVTSYKVNFVDWDDKVLKTESVERGNAAIAPQAPTRAGYSFSGWSVVFDNVESDLVVKAQYKINVYDVKFVDDAGNQIGAIVKVEHGKTVVAPKAPSKAGYTFSGWDAPLTNITKDMTIKAIYKLNEEPPIDNGSTPSGGGGGSGSAPSGGSSSGGSAGGAPSTAAPVAPAVVNNAALQTKTKVEVKPIPPQSEWRYSDVSPIAWYYEAVEGLSERGLLNGTGDGLFSPNQTVNRAMLVTVLYRLAGEPAGSNESAFADVAAGQWYTAAVAWAADKGIVNGYDAKIFGPLDSLTKEQIITVLYRYQKMMGKDVTVANPKANYADMESVSKYAVQPILWAADKGILRPDDRNNISPQSKVTRALLAVMVDAVR